ncbi:MAG: histidine--tRNA ligase [Deltaproteobacteria bacterium]|nr:MAG: histidine--tRNA ligase [Deltaproteobacteria bacterium]
MTRIKPRILKGFRDYLPETMIPRERMLRTIAEVFELHGFSPLATPAIEYSEILLGKYGEEGNKLLYRFEDNGGRDVCLRYDLTVPLARVVAQYAELPRIFKRYQIAPVWRAENPGKGRFREFVQCDVDIVGCQEAIADAACIEVGAAALKKLGVERFVIRINHRALLGGILKEVGVSDPDRMVEIMRVIDKLEKIGEGKVRELLTPLLPAEGIDRLFELFTRQGPPQEILEEVGRFSENQETREGVAALEALFSHLTAMKLCDVTTIDLSIARGLDYYSGAVFETTLLDRPDFGSVMSGGRYDELIGIFCGRQIPAVGISIGVDRLFAALNDLGLLPRRPSVAELLVTCFDADRLSASIEYATLLRRLGIPTEIYPRAEKLAKQFKYANKQRIPYVAVVGPEEVAGASIRIKEMGSGEERTLPLKTLEEKLQGGGTTLAALFSKTT